MKSVSVHQFSMVPRADIPRSSFNIQTAHKTTFDGGYLIPVYVDEVLPGDSFKLKMTAFARLATPLFPVMDNMKLDSFFFFVPNRLVWSNWKRFMGEQENPDDSISFSVPQCVSPVDGYALNSLQDYMGLPTDGQVGAGETVSHSAFHTRAYNLIWNEWFRDENLQDSVVVDHDDGPDSAADYVLLRRGKRHDYFTSCLPWPQKGDSVQLPLGVSAPVVPAGTGIPVFRTPADSTSRTLDVVPAGTNLTQLSGAVIGAAANVQWKEPSLMADLSLATASTINALRQAFQIQKLLERDARGGSRYTEIVRAHFGVTSPDARLQRPEYLGGGSTDVNVKAVAQTSESDGTPLGTLAATGVAVGLGHGFSQSFTEHGVIIGLVAVRADLTYQQGMRRMWSRSTRYDFYFPAFAMLGEQAVLQKEIYCTGDAVDDVAVFGYQERWAEYRYHPSMITGLFRSTAPASLDAWHLAQHFETPPALNALFIADTPPIERIIAVGAGAGGKQFIFDSFFDIRVARPMPMYSVPGMIDHF